MYDNLKREPHVFFNRLSRIELQLQTLIAQVDHLITINRQFTDAVGFEQEKEEPNIKGKDEIGFKSS